MVFGRDKWWSDIMVGVSDQCDPEWLDAEDPLFMLYTRYEKNQIWEMMES